MAAMEIVSGKIRSALRNLPVCETFDHFRAPVPIEAEQSQKAGSIGIMDYQFFTVSEVAELLKVSPDTVARMFASRSGVLDLGAPERLHKRGYRVLRISKSALDAFINDVGV
jgi:hypothetical protein